MKDLRSREKIQGTMFFEKSIQKTKKLFVKSLQNIKSFLFGSYEKIPRTIFLNPLSCTSINQRSHQLDLIYSQFTNQSVSEHVQDNPEDSTKQTIKIIPLKEAIDDNLKNGNSNERTQVAAPRKTELSSASSSCRYFNDDTYILAQKMKELDMIELGDADHAFDIEEALHYYSRLTCPMYVDMVNQFFMDMYAEFLLPQPSISFTSSSRRLGPLKL